MHHRRFKWAVGPLAFLWLIALLFTAQISWACNGACSPAKQIQYCSGTMKYCDGSIWKEFPANDLGVSCSVAGQITYAGNQLRYCNGSTLQAMHAVTGQVTDGTCSSAGAISRNTGDTLFRFCDGTNWVVMALSGDGGGGGSPSGQQQWTYTHAGDTQTSSFVVPVGVTSVSAVAIGTSGWRDLTFHGGGGGLAYINNLTVTPGETLTVEIGVGRSAIKRSSTYLLEARAGNRGDHGGGGGNVGVGTGFNGGYGTDTDSAGNAAGYTANGLNGDEGGNGTSTSLKGPGGGGTLCGGGGTNTFGSQAPGGVRIIWGSGRSYPNTNVADQ